MVSYMGDNLAEFMKDLIQFACMNCWLCTYYVFPQYLDPSSARMSRLSEMSLKTTASTNSLTKHKKSELSIADNLEIKYYMIPCQLCHLIYYLEKVLYLHTMSWIDFISCRLNLKFTNFSDVSIQANW